jgi:tetratricopeptide (TPR) repeat protein
MAEIGERQLNIMEKGLAAKGPIVMDREKLKEVEEQLAKDPENFCLWVARGILYFNEDFEKAIESISHALSIDPFNSDQYYNRGRKFLSQDRYIQALADFTLAVRLDTNDAWKWHFRGVAYFYLARYHEAIDSFYKGIEMHKKNGTHNIPPEVDWIWMSWMRLGDEKEAKKCLDLVDQNTEVERGDLMYKKRVLLYKGTMSLAEFDAAIERDNPKRAITELYGAAAYCHYILKDNKKAIQYLDEVLAYNADRHAFGYKMALVERNTWGKDS